jgi:hypothetical protein
MISNDEGPIADGRSRQESKRTDRITFLSATMLLLETIELSECNRGTMLPTLLPIACRGMSHKVVRTSDVADNRFNRHESSGCDRLLTSFVWVEIRFVRFCPRLADDDTASLHRYRNGDSLTSETLLSFSLYLMSHTLSPVSRSHRPRIPASRFPHAISSTGIL